MERLSAAASGAIVCFGRRLSDPEANRLPGFPSGGLGKAPSAGLKGPTRAVARFHPASVRALGFSTPLGMSPGPPSPSGFSAWRMSMILAAGMAFSGSPIVAGAASPLAVTPALRSARDAVRSQSQDN